MNRLTFVEKRLLERLFIKNGYVLDFTDRTFAEFFNTVVGINIDDPLYREKEHLKAIAFARFSILLMMGWSFGQLLGCGAVSKR